MVTESLIGLTVAEKNDESYVVGVVTKGDNRSLAAFYFVEFMDGYLEDTWFSVEEILDMHDFYKSLAIHDKI